MQSRRLVVRRWAVMGMLHPWHGALERVCGASREGVADRLAELLSLHSENAILREENARLQQWQVVARSLDAENRELRRLLQVPGDPPLGFVTSPDDLLVDEHGTPQRLDKAYSWDAPLAAHGMMHMVITNAVRKDPYGIDVLFMYMANMSWNSAMNVPDTIRYLTQKEPDGSYTIPKIIYSDAYSSEMVAYADLILPDTTYLERWDCISLLDRPISEFDGPVDSVRIPVLPPTGQCKPFQEVLVELASRLGFPAFVNSDGSRKYRDYPDFVVRYEVAPGSGIGFLAGWRGEHGDKSMRGEFMPSAVSDV